MVTNSLCERGVATASKHDDVADHPVLVDLRGGIETVENQWRDWIALRIQATVMEASVDGLEIERA